jgi:hypothetical protein
MEGERAAEGEGVEAGGGRVAKEEETEAEVTGEEGTEVVQRVEVALAVEAMVEEGTVVD